MDIRSYNRAAWDRNVEQGSVWTRPVGPEEVSAARRGEWSIVLTPTKPIPRDWFPDLDSREVLCLASGGGQQGPILAAAGARVTVFDNSPMQLAQDRMVAERERLELATVEGDMGDLSVFADESFDLIVHPTANLYVPDVRRVWAECFRVLRRGGALLAGFLNPLRYLFDQQLSDQGQFLVKYALPYSDMASLSEAERQHYIEAGDALEWGHTLEDQLGGQINAGFVIAGFYEDRNPRDALARYTATHIATRATKPG